MNRAHIPSFSNHIPCIDWKKGLPKFKGQDGEDASLHLVKFHFHIHRLKIEFPEDCLMKMFMDTLEEKARSWYESLPSASLYSLKDFHSIFFQHYQSSNSSLSMIDSCCEISDNFIEFLENLYGDEECLDDEIIESLHDFSSQQESTVSSLDEEILEPLHENPFHHQKESVAPSLDETN